MNTPEIIYEICPSCNPNGYAKTKAKFTGEVDGEELLYQCVDCNAKLWVDEKWARKHEVKLMEN